MNDLIAFFPQTGTITPAPKTEQAQAVAVVQQVVVEQVPSRSDMLTSEAEWTWQEIRDYVVSQIIRIHGPFPRDAKKEFGIFSRFIKTHGSDGVAVAKAAFEIYDGWWAGAPISVNRFTKNSDPYFVTPILERLRDAKI